MQITLPETGSRYASSANGTKLVAVQGGDGLGDIWTSINTRAYTVEIVVLPLQAYPITPLNPTIHPGQSVTLNSDVIWGLPPYNYTWYTSSSTGLFCNSSYVISGATSANYTASPTTTNSYAYLVTDAENNSVCSSKPAGQIWLDTFQYGGLLPSGIASSANGTKLVVVQQNDGDGGDILTTNNSGMTWVARHDLGNWQAVASSADGDNLVAVQNYGDIFTSSDSGATWIDRNNTGYWQAVASSADGVHLAAAQNEGDIFISNDSGATWTDPKNSGDWRGIASSADGTKLAAVQYEGDIFTSNDSGATWTDRNNTGNWTGIVSSADGNNLVAVQNYGDIFTSNDSGATWIDRNNTGYWQAVASSADGVHLVAVQNTSPLLMVPFDGIMTGTGVSTSDDSGVTWTGRDNYGSWTGVASSANGKNLAAIQQDDDIFLSTDVLYRVTVSSPPTTATTTIQGSGGGGTGGAVSTSGGGGGGGPKVENYTITSNLSTGGGNMVQIGYILRNFTVDNCDTLHLQGGKSVHLCISYITSDHAYVVINNVTYNLSLNQPIAIDPSNGWVYFANLLEIRFAPILHAVDMLVYAQQQSNTTTSTTIKPTNTTVQTTVVTTIISTEPSTTIKQQQTGSNTTTMNPIIPIAIIVVVVIVVLAAYVLRKQTARRGKKS